MRIDGTGLKNLKMQLAQEVEEGGRYIVFLHSVPSLFVFLNLIPHLPHPSALPPAVPTQEVPCVYAHIRLDLAWWKMNATRKVWPAPQPHTVNTAAISWLAAKLHRPSTTPTPASSDRCVWGCFDIQLPSPWVFGQAPHDSWNNIEDRHNTLPGRWSVRVQARISVTWRQMRCFSSLFCFYSFIHWTHPGGGGLQLPQTPQNQNLKNADLVML
jgi:hypothetical protein